MNAMDVAYFMKQRTAFIRTFYRESRQPFDEIKRKIESHIAPYEPPPFHSDYDDTEPAFLDEWMAAEMAIHVLGLSCVSLLSDSVKIYFKTLEREYGFRPSEEARRTVFKRDGFATGYRRCLAELLGSNLSDCPVRFDVIEQVVLARNRAQHGDDIHTFHVSHDAATLKKHPKLHFVEKRYRTRQPDADDALGTWFDLQIEVTEQNLSAAIDEVEKLADWVSERDGEIYNWQRRMPQQS